MADNGFNGSTVTFASAALGDGLRGINYSEGGGDVDVSGASDSTKSYESGLSDPSVSVDVVGGVSVSKGDKGALVVGFNDGGSDGSLTNAIVSSVSTSGSMDGEILSNVVFKPSTASS